MRVIAGRLGGRMFDSPGTHRTHPMSDKMRGALFNILGDLGGLNVLDAFGGSGALAFEAISRGASAVLVLDNDKAAQKTIERNIRMLGISDGVKLVRASAGAWLGTNEGKTFDVILCDPPYDDLQQQTLTALAGRLTSSGVLALSYPAAAVPPVFDGLRQLKQQSYGDAQLVFYGLAESR
ncbi:MAG TPA: RsmD family RNA methyltransferase [Candidatus Saccharimonadales bacterium]